eukprot:9711265-Lingulodinium_polyedra.AAC.1
MSNGFPWLPLAPGPAAPPSTPGVSILLRAGTCATTLYASPWAGCAAGACPLPLRAGAGPISPLDI